MSFVAGFKKKHCITFHAVVKHTVDSAVRFKCPAQLNEQTKTKTISRGFMFKGWQTQPHTKQPSPCSDRKYFLTRVWETSSFQSVPLFPATPGFSQTVFFCWNRNYFPGARNFHNLHFRWILLCKSGSKNFKFAMEQRSFTWKCQVLGSFQLQHHQNNIFSVPIKGYAQKPSCLSKYCTAEVLLQKYVWNAW